MSIKPVACADNGVLNWYADSKTAEEVDLYAIPDTHRVVSVELLRVAAGVLENAWHPHLTEAGAKLRAIIEDKP